MRKTESKPWFDVDKKGLQKLLADRGIEFAIFELIQNAWDEAGVSRVDVTLKPEQDGILAAELTVSDDAPNGFADLRHAYTLFAESAKKGNPKQRGRFNIGEKLVLSQCIHASIKTTKGTVHFGAEGKRYEHNDRCTQAGSIFNALIRLSKKDRASIEREVQKLISPANITTTFNGEELKRMTPRFKIEATLPTVLGDEHGDLRHSRRKTTINCYDVIDGEKPLIYEMGIPVVEHDCAFHCDIQQKVELTLDRQNVSERFLRALRLEVFNATHDKLTTEDMNHEWVQTAMEHPDVTREAVTDYATKRFGENRVSFDMSDREANNAAFADDFNVVRGGSASAAVWENLRRCEAIKPAGQVFPTNPDTFIMSEPVTPTDAMLRVAEHAKKFARITLGINISVRFCKQASIEAASYGSKTMSFNVRNLGGEKWFNLDKNRVAIEDLIIHELGHELEANHLSKGYNDALTHIAAVALQATREGRLA